MKMYFVKTPRFFQRLFPALTWQIPTKEKSLFLTFDDGPTPHITPWVLRQLAKYEAKASFFMLGENAARYPHIYHKVKEAGHSIGSHGYKHLSGWNTDDEEYFRNATKCNRQLSTTLFRPPYGRLKPKQVNFLAQRYRIIMWDVLSGDFDSKITPDQCLSNVLQHAESGSIVVFHDSAKARENLYYSLPKVLEYFAARSYTFKALTASAGVKSKLKSA